MKKQRESFLSLELYVRAHITIMHILTGPDKATFPANVCYIDSRMSIGLTAFKSIRKDLGMLLLNMSQSGL